MANLATLSTPDPTLSSYDVDITAPSTASRTLSYSMMPPTLRTAETMTGTMTGTMHTGSVDHAFITRSLYGYGTNSNNDYYGGSFSSTVWVELFCFVNVAASCVGAALTGLFIWRLNYAVEEVWFNRDPREPSTIANLEVLNLFSLYV